MEHLDLCSFFTTIKQLSFQFWPTEGNVALDDKDGHADTKHLKPEAQLKFLQVTLQTQSANKSLRETHWLPEA